MYNQNIFIKGFFDSWHPVIRWIALLPAAFLIFFLGMTFGKYFIAVSLAFGGIELFGGGIANALLTVLGEIISISAVIIFVHDIAPKYKKEVALAFCAIFGAISIYGLALLTFLWDGVSGGDKVTSIIVFAAALIVTIWLAFYILVRNKKAYQLR